MTFDQRLRRMTYLTAVLGMLALGLAEANFVYIGLIVAVAVTGWLREKHARKRLLSPKALNVIILLALGYAVIDYFRISQGWILSVAHFLLIVQMAKLLLPKTDRDYAQIYLISLMNVAVAAIVTANVLFAVTFVLYSGTSILGLILYHFHREVGQSANVYLPRGSETVRPASSPNMSVVVSKRFLWTLVTIILVTWVLNAAFFVLSPRVPAGLARFRPIGLMSYLTGFSENVRLGEIGRILNNESPVMHVELRDESGNMLRGERDLYWRGLTYQYYDGHEWTRLGPMLSRIDALDPKALPYSIDPTQRLYKDVPWIEQTITLEPTGTQTLFALSGVLELHCRDLRRVGIEKNYLDETYRAAIPLNRLKYTVKSSVSRDRRVLLPELLPYRGRLSEAGREAYLQLPRAVSARVHDLARRIAPSGEGLTPTAQAERVEQYLRGNFTYTLDLKSNPDVEPVEDFLFNRQEGHCEYFAAAMVVLLRSLGVPSRLVSGFHGGEWNEVGEWYLVKQSDAHAWVEVYVGEDGWVRYDPTPAAAREQFASDSSLGRLGLWFDYLRTQWMNYVVQYDEEQRSSILNRTRAADRRVRRFLRGALASIGNFFRSVLSVLTDVKRLATVEGVVTIAAVLAASTAVVLTMRWLLLKLVGHLRAALGRRHARRLGRAHVAFYQELQHVLKRRGFVRSPETTPREFARQVADEIGDARVPLEELTEAFYRVRFGGGKLKPEQERHLRSIIESVRSAAISRSQ